MSERERRIGRNEEVFRRVNEQIEQVNEAFGSVAGTMTLVCECGDTSCIEQIELTPEEYERLRSDPDLVRDQARPRDPGRGGRRSSAATATGWSRSTRASRPTWRARSARTTASRYRPTA